MKKISIEKTIRIITLAPIMALIAISLLFALRPGEFYGAANYAVAILCLTVLPLLAYPLQPYIPRYKDQGRAGQRRLAIVMAVVGLRLHGVAVGVVPGAAVLAPEGHHHEAGHVESGHEGTGQTHDPGHQVQHRAVVVAVVVPAFEDLPEDLVLREEA